MVSYQRLEYTKRTLQSILDTTPDVPQCEVVIVDNHSTEEGVVEYLSKMFANNKKLTVVFNPENNGWGSAINLVFRTLDWKSFDYILFSNNDVIYKPNWFEEAEKLMTKYPQIGILGLWKHPYHGIKQFLEDLVIKDDMPAVSWLIPRMVVEAAGNFPEHGACKTRGGNGEDSAYAHRVQNLGLWVCGPKEDLSEHIDGYDIPNLGKENEAYK